jgi:Raf kinase inhibitor-like YbhB/YbcL family protein
LLIVVAFCTALLSVGCGPAEQTPTGDQGDPRSKEDSVMAIEIRSAAFADGEPIPKKYTEDGEDLSPPLRWSGVPQQAVQLALVCDDPDAPRPEPWVHWLLYAIPATVSELPEGLDTAATLADFHSAHQGKNSWPSGRTIGYRGPAPPPGHGTHHYHFKLYALDKRLDLAAGADKAALLAAIDGHIVAEGELVGTYKR